MMNGIDWEYIISRVDLSRFPIELRLTYHEGEIYVDWPNLIITGVFEDSRNEGNNLQVSFTYSIPPVLSEAEALEYIFKWILEVVRHELAEFFIYDGERIFDPHEKKET